MKIALLYYDDFSEFEVVLVGLIFRKHDFITVALEDREYRSEERQRFLVDQVIENVDVDTIDLLVIPGGEPDLIVDNLELKNFIESLLAKNKKVAGICGGACVLGGFGLLKGKKCTGLASGKNPNHPEDDEYFSEAIFLDDHVVVEGNLITAQGQAYVEFAFELARQMELSENEEEYEAGIRWFKNIR